MDMREEKGGKSLLNCEFFSQALLIHEAEKGDYVFQAS